MSLPFTLFPFVTIILVSDVLAVKQRLFIISIYPSVPCTRIRCPSFISLVAFSTPTTAGKPLNPNNFKNKKQTKSG